MIPTQKELQIFGLLYKSAFFQKPFKQQEGLFPHLAISLLHAFDTTPMKALLGQKFGQKSFW